MNLTELNHFYLLISTFGFKNVIYLENRVIQVCRGSLVCRVVLGSSHLGLLGHLDLMDRLNLMGHLDLTGHLDPMDRLDRRDRRDLLYL